MLRAQDALANLSIPSTSGGPPLPPMTPALGDEHERPPTGAPPAVRPAGAGARTGFLDERGTAFVRDFWGRMWVAGCSCPGAAGS